MTIIVQRDSIDSLVGKKTRRWENFSSTKSLVVYDGFDAFEGSDISEEGDAEPSVGMGV